MTFPKHRRMHRIDTKRESKKLAAKVQSGSRATSQRKHRRSLCRRFCSNDLLELTNVLDGCGINNQTKNPKRRMCKRRHMTQKMLERDCCVVRQIDLGSQQPHTRHDGCSRTIKGDNRDIKSIIEESLSLVENLTLVASSSNNSYCKASAE